MGTLCIASKVYPIRTQVKDTMKDEGRSAITNLVQSIKQQKLELELFQFYFFPQKEKAYTMVSL